MKPVFIFVLFYLLSAVTTAQPTSGHSGTGDNIDIKYHRFEWDVNPDNSIYISGKVTTYFVTQKNNVSLITFDLNKSAYNNSNLKVYYHGSPVTVSFPSAGNQNILQVNLPVTLPQDRLDSITVQYAGVPPAPPSGAPGGCFQKTINGYRLFYTLSESYEDRDWWPCKADMQDKIDSIDIIITSPSKYTAAANGKLISETISGTNKISVFRHRYPIASYHIGIAVSQYDKYDRGTVDIGGTQMPVMYYILKGRNPSNAQLNLFDACKDELVIFSDLFGDYPFKKEKYGMYEFGFNGGMEHNTFSGMSWGAFLSSSIVAHELMHQWFGDKVTMSTWNHLWLSEGFASYGEVLAAEKVSSLGLSAASKRASMKSSANSTAQRIYGAYVPDSYITGSGALWGSQYGNTVYTRGGMVVSMLRTLMGDDKFFQACRNYLNDPALAYGAAKTENLQAHMEAELNGFDLSGFFDSYVYGNGYPMYGDGSNGQPIKWQAVGSDMIRFRVDPPAKSTGSDVSTYYSVIPLRVRGAGGKDTLIVLYDQGTTGVSVGGNGITFGNSPTPEVYLGFTPTSVSFDPYSMSLATGSTIQETVAPVSILSFSVSEKNGGVTATLQADKGARILSVLLEKSYDGIQFLPVGNMDTKEPGRYYYNDLPTSETIFYRARITEPTGEITYSAVVRIAGRGVPSFSLVSNPVRNIVKIKVPSQAIDGAATLIIYDATGRTVLKTSRKPVNGMIRTGINNLKNGTYFIHIQFSGKHQMLKFIVSQ